MKFNSLLALAFEHHLAIAKNIPLKEVVSWIINIAPLGLIEFVDKSDTTIQHMLSLKGDIFPDYNEENFKKYIEQNGVIVNISKISQYRKIYEYKRD